MLYLGVGRVEIDPTIFLLSHFLELFSIRFFRGIRHGMHD